MYKLIRPLLFSIDAEKIHHIVFKVLQIKGKLPGFKALLKILFNNKSYRLQATFKGLTFNNPVGLAAGFDKNALLIDELACFGFGFIEVGTLTPRPQPGNDKPRLFRLPLDKALINRMGFNNDGVMEAVNRLKKRKSNIIVGGNIGKNKTTPNENALDDYRFCFEHLYPCVDYFVINVSSPNTPGLRELQEKEPLRNLLVQLKALRDSKETRKPVLLKIAPDLTHTQLDDIISILKESGIDGVIATNTTISREGLETSQQTLDEIGTGGLSGKPLTGRSLEIVRYLRRELGKDFLIIGSGGIMTPQDAVDRINAGADLVQVYTGFIYEGPGFVKRILKELKLPVDPR
jgi:dihydroorotate dehydrogenase